VLTGDWTPLHAPNSCWKLDFILSKIMITFSSRFLSLKETVPLIVPKAKVCPSADHPEQMIFYLNFSLGMSFLPGMKSAKSEFPPLKSS